jgi:hypothetical protein
MSFSGAPKGRLNQPVYEKRTELCLNHIRASGNRISAIFIQLPIDANESWGLNVCMIHFIDLKNPPHRMPARAFG